jgi:hypothetical protein
MLPYTGPDFVEALLSLMADEPAMDTSAEAPKDPTACKNQDDIESIRHATSWTPFSIVEIVAIACLICLIVYLIVV